MRGPAVPGRVRLRPPRDEDLGDVFRIHADPRTNVHNPAGPDRDRAASGDRLRGWLTDWDTHGVGYQAVELAGSGEVVGFTGVRHSSWLELPVLNLYYRYAAEHHGYGYATEGARAVVAWARSQHPGVPVLAVTTRDNVGSQRTARAAGLVRRPDLEHVWNGRWSVVLASHWPYPHRAMTLQERTATPEEAVELARWVYPPPWDRYSHDSADPALYLTRGPHGEGYHPALDVDGEVVGFCVLGAEARIPGQHPEPGTVDLGMGVRPDLTSGGLGTVLLEQALALAAAQPGHRRTRVVVAADNTRSFALCRRAGFDTAGRLAGPGGREFHELVRR